MKEATVGYILRDSETRHVLMGKRRSLFCDGIWNGPGGKMRKSERAVSCLRREIREEVGIIITGRKSVHFSSMDFYNPSQGDYVLGWRVHFFLINEWVGEPKALDGFSELEWFPIENLPYDRMNVDVHLWVPPCLNGIARGRLMEGEVYYGADMTIVDQISYRFVNKPTKRLK